MPKNGPREVMVNHFEKNHYLVSKAGLLETLQHFHGMKELCNNRFPSKEPFWPETYYVGTSVLALEEVRSPAFFKDSCRYWIVKPASGTNRGTGIKIAETWEEVQEVVNQCKRECIVHMYLERPLLLGKKRKFDIRCFVLLDGSAGYLHKLCYARAAGLKYSLSHLRTKAAHLTNDAVQKHDRSYGRFEPGNKLSMEQLSKQIQVVHGHKDAVNKIILPRIREIVKDTLMAAIARGMSASVNVPERARVSCFELFGFDFLVDSNLRVYLLEVNQNPCLEQTCAILRNYIQNVVEDVFDIVLKPFRSTASDQMEEPRASETKENQFERVL